jgi:hypothetical protein
LSDMNTASNKLHAIRKAAQRFLLVYVIAFGINLIWEMLQMPFYEQMAFTDVGSYLMCLKASFGDANIVIAIYGLGLLLFRRWRWPLGMNLWKVLYLVAIGGTVAVLIEHFALRADRWSYSSLMPLLPLLGTGLIPFLQLIILPYLSYAIACRRRLCRPQQA